MTGVIPFVSALIFTATLLVGIANAQLSPLQGKRFRPFVDTTVTNAATLIQTADGARVTIVCTNNDAGVNVRVGDSAVTATKGVRLAAGASISIGATSAIYMISEGANVTVSCAEELH